MTAKDPIDELAKAIANGNITVTSVRVRVCGGCKTGTLQSKPTPNWMNRYVCDHCGKKVSR